MASVNKVILVGNLGQDPELRYAANGDAICNISVATTDSWKDKTTGEKKEQTEWHRVSFFGKLAEIAGQYLNKGSAVYIEGSLRTRKWQDKQGQDRYTTEIKADTMQMLGGRERGEQQPVERQPAQQSAPQSHSDAHAAAAQAPRRPAAAAPSGGGVGGMDDDIPFAPIGRRELFVR